MRPERQRINGSQARTGRCPRMMHSALGLALVYATYALGCGTPSPIDAREMESNLEGRPSDLPGEADTRECYTNEDCMERDICLDSQCRSWVYLWDCKSTLDCRFPFSCDSFQQCVSSCDLLLRSGADFWLPEAGPDASSAAELECLEYVAACVESAGTPIAIANSHPDWSAERVLAEERDVVSSFTARGVEPSLLIPIGTSSRAIAPRCWWGYCPPADRGVVLLFQRVR
jgi:hypothetical protein